MGEQCCWAHMDPLDGQPGWCINSSFAGCEPCCLRCPDYDWYLPDPDGDQDTSSVTL